MIVKLVKGKWKRGEDKTSDVKAITHHVLWADQYPASWVTSQNPLFSLLLQSMTLCGMEHSSGQFGSAHLCPLPAPLWIHCRGRVRIREGPDALHTLLSSIRVLSALFWAKPKPRHCMSCYGENELCPSQARPRVVTAV